MLDGNWKRAGALALTAAVLAAALGGCGPAGKEDAPAGGEGAPRAEASDKAPKAATAPRDVVKPAVGYRAPDIVARDVFTGEAVKLSDLRGKVVMLNFWATWCPPCRVEMPHMEAFHQEAGDRVVIVALGGDGRESPETLKAFAEEAGLTFTIAHDGGIGLQRYQVVGLPTSVFIDQSGIIRARVTRPLTKEQMAALALEAERAGKEGAGEK